MLNPSTDPDYTGKVNPPDAEFPNGSARDAAVENDPNATPILADKLNDYWGADAALTESTGVIPSGNPDTALASQRLIALKRIASRANSVTFGDVASLIAGNAVGAQVIDFAELAAVEAQVSTVSYYGGWAATILRPQGGSVYSIVTALSFGAVPDGLVNFYVGGAVEYVAVLSHDGVVSAFQAGAKADGTADVDPDACQAILDLGFEAHHEKGVYTWNKSVNPWAGSKITGAGFKDRVSEIVVSPAVIAIGHANAVVNGSFEELKDVLMSGLAWSGASGSVVKVLDADIFYDVEWEVFGCWFSQSLESALQARLLTSIVRDNRFGQSEGGVTFATHKMLYMKGTNAPAFAEINNTQVMRNRFRECPAAGFALYADYGFDLTVKWNTFQACANYPIILKGVYPAVVESNYFEANTAPAYGQVSTDTAGGSRWCLVTWRNNFGKQTAGLEALVDSSDDSRVWIDFHGNAGDVKYLNRKDDGGGGWINEASVRDSYGNFTGTTYLGDKAFHYHKINWSPTASIEGARWDNEINQQYEFGNSSTGIALGGVSNYRGLTGIHALVEGLSDNSNTTIATRSNRSSENFRVVGNWNGVDYLGTWLQLRASDGLATAIGVYNSTTGDAANVSVDATGLLRRSSSSRRYKTNERPPVFDFSAPFRLTPVLFDFKDNVFTEVDDNDVEVTVVEPGQKDVMSYIAEDSGPFASLDAEGLPNGINWNLVSVVLVHKVEALEARLASALERMEAAGI